MKKDIKDYLHLYLGCEGEVRHGEILKLTTQVLHQSLNPKSGMDFKPILRPLSDMTEEEKIMLCCLNLPEGWKPGHIIDTNDDDIAAMRIFDYNGGVKSLYVPKKRIEPKNFLWLLKQGFDLFGLIESGLAIDKTKQQL